MPDSSSIYQLRRKLAEKRQPNHRQACDELHDRMAEFDPPLDHPYELGLHYLDFIEHPALKNGAEGLIAAAPSVDYLYRLLPLPSLVRDIWLQDTRGWRYLPPGVVDSDGLLAAGIPLLGRALERRLAARGDWLPLEGLASGELAPVRSFTWWTSHRIDLGRIVIEAQRSGIPTDWVVEWTAVLRCRVAALDPDSQLRIPTVLDAFDSPIFHPTVDADNPTAGIAIDLRGGATLREGTDEFALRPIAVESLDLWPLQLGRAVRRRDAVHLGGPLYEQLEAYYNAL